MTIIIKPKYRRGFMVCIDILFYISDIFSVYQIYILLVEKVRINTVHSFATVHFLVKASVSLTKIRG